ncbi:LuxR C-terminal-related transcriptional regulator [Vibrio rhodolitus]|uniref:LuxR C-terminal-related transcriptional regulator n=1 Tax=Vibrio rhodolitus TaxID=2231649 RepID=UPI001ABF5EB6|nr:LuxR C-terminal-related transcriptional regulator [Vibrio rhodolitus]
MSLSPQITLLSDVSMQSRLFKDSLERGIEQEVDLISLEDFHTKAAQGVPSLGDYILIDYNYFDASNFEIYNNLRNESNVNGKEIVINCPKDVSSAQLFKWRNLVGVFYVEDEMNLLLKGMKKIMSDEMWLSRRVAQDYIEHFRSANVVTTSQVYANLTKREKEIMRLLGQGASNQQIADELFVSENTVKTHLHNIFKKINAKNRLQALLWANNNISLEERA